MEAGAATSGAISSVHADSVGELIKKIAVALASGTPDVVNKALGAADAAAKVRTDRGDNADAALQSAENDAISAAVAANPSLTNQLTIQADASATASAPAPDSAPAAAAPSSTPQSAPGPEGAVTSAPATLTSLQLTLSSPAIGLQSAAKVNVAKVMSDATSVPLDGGLITLSFYASDGTTPTPNLLACGDRIIPRSMASAATTYVIKASLKSNPSIFATGSLVIDPSLLTMGSQDSPVASCIIANGGDPANLSILPSSTATAFFPMTVYQDGSFANTAPVGGTYEFVDADDQDVPASVLSYMLMPWVPPFPSIALITSGQLTAGSTYGVYIKVGDQRLSSNPLKITVSAPVTPIEPFLPPLLLPFPMLN